MSEKTKFEFRVYSARWGHDDVYTILCTEDGWNVSHVAINGPCKPDGSPVLYKNLDQDSIAYPEAMKSDMEYIWEKHKDGTLSAAEVQEKLNLLAQWVEATAAARPNLWD